MKKKVLWISALLLATGVIMAQVPNQFKTGDSLSSAKMNENFAYLTKLVKDGAGNILGQLISVIGSDIYVFTSKGYRFGYSIAMSGSMVQYSTPGVTGTHYKDAGCTTLAPGGIYFVNTTEYPGMVYYITMGTPGIYYTEKTGSRRIYSNTPPCTLVGYELIPNDPAVTGVFSSTITLPITITTP